MSAQPDYWPHAPVHRLAEAGTFMVTSATYGKAHVFRQASVLRDLQAGLLRYAARYRWRLEAWAVFSNHYHFIGHSPDEEIGGAKTLSRFLAHFHSRCSAWINRLDDCEGRKVWHNFWDTRLTHQRSYLARLHYVHANAVHHRLVSEPAHYPWCSAGWFERNATNAQVKTIYGMAIDRVNVSDDFQPVLTGSHEN